MHETIETVFSCSGETAIITGGGTGIGYAMASCLVRAGARVALVGRREDILAEAAGKLGGKTVYRVYDVTKSEGAESVVESIEKEIGPVSILVNNAGHVWKGPAEETPTVEFDKLFDTHVSGPFALCKAVIPGMKTRGKGHLLFTASMAALFGLPGVVGYAAAKSAILGVVRSLAVELSPDGIRVNAIAPGWITSELLLKTVEADPERKRKVLSRTPMGRFGTAEEVGWAAVYLSSPAASFVTGVCFPVDGGISIGF